MAGYLFTFSSEEDMRECVEAGRYSTLMNRKWSIPTTSTLGDYITMRAGDSVYFFSQRKVYGIGEIIDVEPGRCVTENFLGATSRNEVLGPSPQDAIIPFAKEANRISRWIIAFRPSPLFFSRGVDMDDLLSSNPVAFRSLRVFWKRSFIKLDDEENEAFKAAILRANLVELKEQEGMTQRIGDYTRLRYGEEPRVPQLLSVSRKADGSLVSEMLLEVGILYQLTNSDPITCDVFGKWDYLSHQVNASPFKPVDYMDKIDIFGYKWIESFAPIVEKYLVAELKKGDASASDIPQVMKYVDWVRGEYAHGDYSLIRAFLIAHHIDQNCLNYGNAERDYVVGYRPAEARKWSELAFVEYYVEKSGYIRFTKKG